LTPYTFISIINLRIVLIKGDVYYLFSTC
jgi:hypothetical protein